VLRKLAASEPDASAKGGTGFHGKIGSLTEGRCGGVMPWKKIGPRCIAVLLMSLLAQSILAATHTVTFSEDELLFSEINGYDRVLLKNGTYLTELGKPQLPTRAIRVIIPPGSKVTGITVDNASKVRLQGTFVIAPAQEMELACLPPPKLVEPEPSIYGKASEYPGNLVALMGESYADGSYEVAHLLVYPLQYVPVVGELYLYRSITFTLTLEKGGPPIPQRKQRQETSKKSTDIMLRETVVNPEDLDANRVLPQGTQDNGAEVHPSELLPAPADVDGPAEYVVITSDMAMADAFEPLLEWRIKKGITARTFTVAWIEANYSGVDIQEKIKDFIYDSYMNRGTQHVLLGGNSDLVPVRYSYIYQYDSLHNGEAATDLYYSNCSVGDEEWVVHEGPQSPTPHVTYNPPEGSSINALLPRVNLGRLLVADEYQVADVTHKILAYERSVPATDYQQTFLYNAADEGGRTQYEVFVDEAIPDYLRPFPGN
jgi:hypothetical protein